MESSPSDEAQAGAVARRSNSFSQGSETSQTAAEFIRSQEILEADAREAMPYSIDTCTKILGPLRQNIFACLTCTPPPKTSSDDWIPAGVCYACSVQCHGEHELVEIFQKRNFTCDCGTTRLASTNPCTIRVNNKTNTKGGVHSEEPDVNNKYNQNFRNRFCGCECDYDPFQQKGAMFQCLGLGTDEIGGCGEDWFHPGCLVGMGPSWFEVMERAKSKPQPGTVNGHDLATISEDADSKENGAQDNIDSVTVEDADEEVPMPPGFPEEEDFESFICYKCVESNPWIKVYAGTSGFLPPVCFHDGKDLTDEKAQAGIPSEEEGLSKVKLTKRKAGDSGEDQSEAKRNRREPSLKAEATEQTQDIEAADGDLNKVAASDCKLPNLALSSTARFSLFFKEDFREKFCRCSSCYKHLDQHPQLLEEEETYEPPISEDGASQHGGSTHGSGSLLERGESALRNVDRVRAIEGVMAYNHLKEKLKPFFQQFAESGEAIGAEDIKAYFAKLRGDEDGMKKAGEAAAKEGSSGNDHDRQEQSGY